MNSTPSKKGILDKYPILKHIVFNDVTTLALRLLILYVVIFITQVVFYIYNHESLGNITLAQLPLLLKGSIVFSNISIIYINSLFIVLSMLPFRFRAHRLYQKILFWIYIISNSLAIVVLNLADVIYFHFSLKRLTSEELFYLENTNNAPIVKNVIMHDWWVVLLAAALIFLMVFVYKKIKYHSTKIKKSYVYYSINTLILSIVILVCVAGIRGGFRLGLRPYTLSNAAFYTENPQQANLILSNPFCVLRTLQVKALDNPHYFDEKEVNAIFTPYHYPKTPSVYHFDKPNVMIFIMESFSKEHSKFYCPELYSEEEGFTPFLDSLMGQSYVFTQAFSNGMKSIDALPSILTSIPSYKRSFVLLPQSLATTEGLPKILNNQGYGTYFFCGAEKNSMGFEAYAKIAGINTFYSRNDFEAERKVDALTVEPYWGVFDVPFFQYVADKLEDISPPFFASVFNLTSHHPYVIPADYEDKVPQGHTLIHKCVAYTDLAFRKFFDRAKNQPWFKNTIFVFIADHVSPQKYAEITNTPKGSTAIFYFIYAPGSNLKGLDSSVTQQLDVMPTLLGLIGHQKPYFAFGRDVFNEKERFPMASNYINQLYQCITDDISIYLSDKGIQSAYSAADLYQEDNIVEQNSESQQKALLQLKALLQSYFNHVNDKKYIVPESK
ncbi:MAG: sulfatase-like hydrolase/transferase [Bacteroidales bacterium]|nr:sulfatase-like hydrolase/transferase [Bacteroidales bacterium]